MANLPEDILQGAAKDDSIDVSQWQPVLKVVLSKLEYNVHYVFPKPQRNTNASATVTTNDQDQSGSHEFKFSGNAGPVISDAGHDAPIEDSLAGPGDEGTTSTEADKTSTTNGQDDSLQAPHGSVNGDSPAIPQEAMSLYTSCINTLRTRFASKPPYTIQRLAELTLYPTKHYRFLLPYLAALDQCLSVSSFATDFPLPQLHISSNSSFLSNGEVPALSFSEQQGQENDDSLGGALLTPIPWLKREPTLADAVQQRRQSLQDPEQLSSSSGATEHAHSTSSSSASLHTTDEEQSMSTERTLRAEGAVTQGELLRQEQEAGVVPVGQAQRRLTTMSSDILASAAGTVGPSDIERAQNPSEEDDNTHLQPHARGPSDIGMEDMGPQAEAVGSARPLDLEGAVGRGRSKSPQPPDLSDEQVRALTGKEENMPDAT